MNDYLRNGRDSFLIELGKYGLGQSDLVANMNWFSRVDADARGRLSLAPGYQPGTKVRLRFEMDSIIVCHTCPHPFNESPSYPETEVQIALGKAPPVGEDDFCRNSCEENTRGFTNTELYYFGR